MVKPDADSKKETEKSLQNTALQTQPVGKDLSHHNAEGKREGKGNTRQAIWFRTG